MRSGRRGSEAIHHPNYAVAHVCDVEIQQISKLETAESQVALQLATMNWKDCLDCLQFDDDAIVHEEIDPVTMIDCEVLVTNWDRNLTSDF